MTAGGKRDGAGRDRMFGEKEETKRIMISIPGSKEAEIKEKIEKILKKYISKKKNAKVRNSFCNSN